MVKAEAHASRVTVQVYRVLDGEAVRYGGLCSACCNLCVVSCTRAGGDWPAALARFQSGTSDVRFFPTFCLLLPTMYERRQRHTPLTLLFDYDLLLYMCP